MARESIEIRQQCGVVEGNRISIVGTTAERSSNNYGSFGNGASTASPNTDPFGYGAQCGYYTDRSTGLILCGSRYYNPGNGRRVTRDPIGYGGGLNLYAYTANRPTGFSDPSGLQEEEPNPDADGGGVAPLEPLPATYRRNNPPGGYDPTTSSFVEPPVGKDATSYPADNGGVDNSGSTYTGAGLWTVTDLRMGTLARAASRKIPSYGRYPLVQ